MRLINQAIVKIMPIFPRSFIGLFSSRYIAGETLKEAIDESKKLNNMNMWISLDVLGEHIASLEEAQIATNNCIQVLDAIHENDINGNLSIKLTQMGLKLDKSACQENAASIMERARKYNNFLRIDMEDSTCTDDTIDICLNLRKQYDQVGTVIQSYLKRSEDDVKSLAEKGVNVRICKGIYNEPASIAFKNSEEIRENFKRLIEIMMDHQAYTGIATHDPLLIDWAFQEIQKRNLSTNFYEFQMLLGVAENLRSTIISNGHHLRVYIPFGEEWYSYSVRRLKENPQLAGYVLKNLFTRG